MEGSSALLVCAFLAFCWVFSFACVFAFLREADTGIRSIRSKAFRSGREALPSEDCTKSEGHHGSSVQNSKTGESQ